MDVCGSEALYLPIAECDECGALLERIQALEDLLAGKGDVAISMRDTNNEDVNVTVIGAVG